MQLDREYVVAALTGAMINAPERVAILKMRGDLGITPAEERRAAVVAIQVIMQGIPPSIHRREVDPFDWANRLAREHMISDDELENMAWEVVRGVLETKKEDEGAELEPMIYSAMRFLSRMRRLPKGPSFPNFGMVDSFKPTDGFDRANALVMDLVYHSLEFLNVEDLPPQLLALCLAAGIIKD